MLPGPKKHKWVHPILNIMGFIHHFLFKLRLHSQYWLTENTRHEVRNLGRVGGSRVLDIIKIHEIVYEISKKNAKLQLDKEINIRKT